MKLLLLFAFCVVSVALVHAFDSTDDNQLKSAKNVPSDRTIKSTGERSSDQIRKSENGHGLNVGNKVHNKKLHDKTQRMSNSKLKKASREGKIVKHKKKASRDGKIVKHKKKASREGKIVKHKKKASRDGKIVKHKKKASRDGKIVKKMDHQSKKSCAGACVEDAHQCTHGTIIKSKCQDGLQCCVSDEPRVKMEEKRKVCRANKKCTKKRGSCQPRKKCSGSIVKGKLCTGGCVCCVSGGSSCTTKKSCKAVNGACGPLSQSCSGQWYRGKQYCKGSGCGCCSPTAVTATSPVPVQTTTPVQNTAVSSSTSTNSTTTTTTCSISRLYCAGCGQNNIVVPASRIVNGSDASPGEYPYQVRLVSTIAGRNFECGGSIIKKRWILSAAHCFFNESGTVKATNVNVGVGSIFTNNFTWVATLRFITHENYNSTTYANDIALVELAADLPFETNPNVQPICLGQESDIPYGGKVVATGWGDLAYGQEVTPPILQEVQLDVITIGVCAQLAYLPPNPAQVLCTNTLYKDTCQGDSGGPVVAQVCPGRWVQVGIVSFGVECAVPNNPGVSTRVSAYADWITQNTGSSTC